MKKPMFNEFQRMIIKEDKTLGAAFLKLHIALKKLQRVLHEEIHNFLRFKKQ